MAQAKRKSLTKPNWLLQMHYRLREGSVILLAAAALFLFLSLFTYHDTDPGWSRTGSTADIANLGGYTGAWFSDVFFLPDWLCCLFIPYYDCRLGLCSV